MITKAWAWRAALMTVAALLLPACKDTNSSILFQEPFNGPFPGTSWTMPPPTGSAAAVKDVLNGVGMPLSSLLMTASSAPSAVTTETTSSFSNAPLTFSVHMAAKTSAGSEQGVGTITIRDSIAGVIASAAWDEGTNFLTVSIGGTTVPVGAPASDLTFHRIKFNLESGGSATWTLDNAAPLVTETGVFPLGTLTLELGASFASGTGFALFYFDNVNVTSP